MKFILVVDEVVPKDEEMRLVRLSRNWTASGEVTIILEHPASSLEAERCLPSCCCESWQLK